MFYPRPENLIECIKRYIIVVNFNRLLRRMQNSFTFKNNKKSILSCLVETLNSQTISISGVADTSTCSHILISLIDVSVRQLSLLVWLTHEVVYRNFLTSSAHLSLLKMSFLLIARRWLCWFSGVIYLVLLYFMVFLYCIYLHFYETVKNRQSS